MIDGGEGGAVSRSTSWVDLKSDSFDLIDAEVAER
jgi:hypothetical protein